MEIKSFREYITEATKPEVAIVAQVKGHKYALYMLEAGISMKTVATLLEKNDRTCGDVFTYIRGEKDFNIVSITSRGYFEKANSSAMEEPRTGTMNKMVDLLVYFFAKLVNLNINVQHHIYLIAF